MTVLGLDPGIVPVTHAEPNAKRQRFCAQRCLARGFPKSENRETRQIDQCVKTMFTCCFHVKHQGRPHLRDKSRKNNESASFGRQAEASNHVHAPPRPPQPASCSSKKPAFFIKKRAFFAQMKLSCAILRGKDSTKDRNFPKIRSRAPLMRRPKKTMAERQAPCRQTAESGRALSKLAKGRYKAPHTEWTEAMHSIRLIRRQIGCVCAFLSALTTVALAQAEPGSDQRELRFNKWLGNRRVEEQIDISDPAFVPNKIEDAARAFNCLYENSLNYSPIRLITAGRRHIALVFCENIVGSDRAFEFIGRDAQAVNFPFLAEGNGFGVTPMPGVIKWIKEEKVFVAVTGSDVIPSMSYRHTYRLGSTAGAASSGDSFVLVRVESMNTGDEPENWTVVWEATVHQ